MQKEFSLDDIGTLATLLQTQVLQYTEKHFPVHLFPEVNNLVPNTLVDVLTKLLSRDEAKASLAPKGYVGSAKSTVVTWGLKATSTVGITNAPPEYHRLPHLLYFAEKAQELKSQTVKLQGFAEQYSALFDEVSAAAATQTANSLIQELEELFKTTKELTSCNYNTMIVATINSKSVTLVGMKNWGQGELGTGLTAQILDKFASQLENFKVHILSKATSIIQTKQVEKSGTFKVIEDTTYAVLQKQLQGPTDSAVKEIALAREKADLEAIKRAEAERREKESTAQRTLLEQEIIASRQQQERLEQEITTLRRQTAPIQPVNNHSAVQTREQTLAAQQHADMHEKERQLTRLESQLIAARTTVSNLLEKNESTQQKFAKVREVSHQLDAEGLCQLHHAIIANEKERVEQLLLTSDANHKTGAGYSPLYLAIFDLKTPYKLRDNLNVEIVKLLLQNDANPNENFGHCSYLFSAVFQRNNNAKRPYEPRGKKIVNLKLIENLVLYGANLETSPDDAVYKLNVVQDNIPGIIADKTNATPAAQLLRTCMRFSVKNLTELMQSKNIITTAFARLQENNAPLIQKETAILGILYNRYLPVFTIYLQPKNHIKAIETINALDSKEFQRDQEFIVKSIQRITALRDKAKRANPNNKTRNEYDDLICILNELDACILKVQQMYEPRYQSDPSKNHIFILTEFEQNLIIRNLPAAEIAFDSNETDKLRSAMRNAQAQRPPQANGHDIALTDADAPQHLKMN